VFGPNSLAIPLTCEVFNLGSKVHGSHHRKPKKLDLKRIVECKVLKRSQIVYKVKIQGIYVTLTYFDYYNKITYKHIVMDRLQTSGELKTRQVY
jgi:hypothetical protein